MRGASKAVLHAATRRAITKQLPLEGLCMQSSTCPRNHFCFETCFRRLRASAREKKIETELPKTNTKPIPNILAPVLPDSEAPLPRNSKLNTQRRRTRGLTPGWPDSWASTLNAGGRDRAGQEWVAWGPGDRGVACHMEGLEQSQGTSLAKQKKAVPLPHLLRVYCPAGRVWLQRKRQALAWRTKTRPARPLPHLLHVYCAATRVA